MKNLTAIWWVALLITTPLLSIAQRITWDTSPRKGFVFQISNDEAEKLLTAVKPDSLFKDLLHTQVDTFDVTKGWIHRPNKGHFVLARIVENKLICEYTSVFPYQVFLLKEYNALALQVVDLEGNVRDDADVRFKLRKIRIDRQSNTYRVENNWFYGDHRVVTVELDGFRSVFSITKKNAPEWTLNNYYDEGPSFYSYLVTDKNKYRPGEKVRFKSYALSGVRHPLHRDLEIRLYNGGKPIKVGNISAHRPGSYAGEFVLHDSLKLKLDTRYELSLVSNNGRVVSRCNFRYEDYELNGTRLEVDLSASKQYHPAKNELFIKATDINGLPLVDAIATVVVKPQNIRETFQPLIILRDTLLVKEVPIETSGPTVVDIPSDIFQESNTSYEVFVSVRNTQNQLMQADAAAQHVYSQYEITTRFSSDSIIYEMTDNGVPAKNVPMKLQRNDEPDAIDVLLPYKEEINSSDWKVVLKSEKISRDIWMNTLFPEVDLEGGIEKDSFNVQLRNPQQLDVSWHIYQGSELLEKGFGKELDYRSRIADRSETYYAEVLYSFGGAGRIKRKDYEFKNEHLNVSLDIPERAYPGQEVEALIKVTNEEGNPVSNVDLTALGANAKLEYFLPDLPYYGDSSNPRSKGATYSKGDINNKHGELMLDYKVWSLRAGLDTMKYYQFTYPGPNMFVHEVPIAGNAQFAPYVMKDGAAIDIYVVEVNRQPVYFSWVDQPDQYSFYAPTAQPCEVTLRLFDRVLVFRDMKFSPKKKTILSVDIDNLPFYVETIEIGLPRKKRRRDPVWHSFTGLERNRYIEYLSSFEHIAGNAWLTYGGRFFPLFNSTSSRWIVAGPINPGSYTFTSPGQQLNISYRHTGGYLYRYEQNVVYKLNAERLIPERLFQTFGKPMQSINDMVMTKDVFLKETPKINRWHTRVIDLVDRNLRMKVLLPEEKEASGLAAFLFENTRTRQLISPCQDVYGTKSEFFTIPRGLHNIIVMYNNGTYLKMDSIMLESNTQVVADMNNVTLKSKDPSLSQRWINTVALMDCYPSVTRREIQMRVRNSGYLGVGNIRGVIYADDNSPLPGANIVIKGTTIGTTTDVDGNFSIEAEQLHVTLVISFIGYMTQQIDVQVGSDISVTMQPDVTSLSEVVVVGYGIERRELLTASVTSLSGLVAGVQVESDIPEAETEPDVEERIEAERKLYHELLALNTIRSRFADVAFWEPKLFTDKKGESKFKITYPDDITRWEAVVYAMNRRLQTGTGRKTIKSYKPIVAELYTPQFLTRGDSATLIGRVTNYTGDESISGKVITKRAQHDLESNVQFGQFHKNDIPVYPATTDSLTASYIFTRDDGYKDGEERKIPVVEQGIVRANGTLTLLQNNESVNVKALPGENITVELMANPLDVFAGEARYLLNYRYDCNEQLASKLLGFLNYKLLTAYEGKNFKYDKDVNKIIGRLLKNQNDEFLWSWWQVSPNTSYWMSAHVLTALHAAKEAGYKVSLDIENIRRKFEYRVAIRKGDPINSIDLIHALVSWGVQIDYSKYIQRLDSLHRVNMVAFPYSSHLKEKFLLQEIRQLAKLPVQVDTLLRYRKDGILGDVRFSDDKPVSYWYNNDLVANAIAYRVARREPSLQHMLVPLQMYFIAQRSIGEWNTYHSSNILSAVLPDLLTQGARKDRGPVVKLSGKTNANVDHFPYTIELNGGEELRIQKASGLPVYFMKYRKERVTTAQRGTDGFNISTRWSCNDAIIEAGKPVDLIVEVDVKKESDLEYVMIEIPIPGSCSYASKDQYENRVETHREYFKDRTVIFCERMSSGRYVFNVHLLPRFTGHYFINPSQVSLMYFPVVNANNDIMTVKVN